MCRAERPSRLRRSAAAPDWRAQRSNISRRRVFIDRPRSPGPITEPPITEPMTEHAMTLPIRLACALVPLAVAAIAAPARGQQAPPGPAPALTQPIGAKPTGSDADEAKAIRDANSKMHSAMVGLPPSGNADHDFIASMIPHHQGAIDMATVELQYGRDDETRRLAERIIATQQQEIAEMNTWLAKHPVPAK
jgi:hypothetical protein